MCPFSKVIYQSKNGVITYCQHNHLFQVMYKNLCFELYEWELEALKTHLSSLDVAFWENQLKTSITHRKIPISVGAKHFIILLSKNELAELMTLLYGDTKKVNLLNHIDIEYTFIEN